jgi:hypothetical protein
VSSAVSSVPSASSSAASASSSAAGAAGASGKDGVPQAFIDSIGRGVDPTKAWQTVIAHDLDQIGGRAPIMLFFRRQNDKKTQKSYCLFCLKLVTLPAGMFA